MAATALAAQALRRVARFESRTGHPIERVMVPPHEACSAATVAALLRCGYEGISMTIPFPWLGIGHGDWLARPPHADALVGWRPLDRGTGLPTILRHPLVGRSPVEMRLRAYLDQPLVLYGHHDDLAPGLDLLAEAQAEVAAIAPDTAWKSLAAITRRAYETRREGPTLAVRPLGNQLRVEVPAGIESLRFEPPAGPSSPRLIVDGQASRVRRADPRPRGRRDRHRRQRPGPDRARRGPLPSPPPPRRGPPPRRRVPRPPRPLAGPLDQRLASWRLGPMRRESWRLEPMRRESWRLGLLIGDPGWLRSPISSQGRRGCGEGRTGASRPRHFLRPSGDSFVAFVRVPQRPIRRSLS